MSHKKILFPLIFLLSSSFIYADTISDEEMKKALEGISTTRIIKANEPQIIPKATVVDKKEKIIKSKTQKITKKRRIKRRHSKNKIYKRRVSKKKVQKIDVSELKDVETFGVINTSKPFTLKD